jgi:prophage regulatory protein
MEARFVGPKEIQTWFGVSRQRIQQMIARSDWPAPCAVLSTGRIWLREDVEVWVARHRPDLLPGATEPG